MWHQLRVPTEGEIVKIQSSKVILFLLRNYNKYPLLNDRDKRMVEEHGLIELIPHNMPEYMYGVATAEHWASPLCTNVDKYETNWAVEYHLKVFDESKKTTKLFWGYDVETVKWPEDGMMDADDETLLRSFQYNHYYMEWERKAFVYRCWYCHKEGCDRMIFGDKLSYIFCKID